MRRREDPKGPLGLLGMGQGGEEGDIEVTLPVYRFPSFIFEAGHTISTLVKVSSRGSSISRV